MTPDYGDTSAYFNRGVVLSQFMARIMQAKGWKPEDIETHAGEIDDQIRNFLSGELRLALLALLDDTLADKTATLNAALFELSDTELLGRLEKLGKRVDIVLANGSVKKKGEDENSDARKRLKAAGATVLDRMAAPGFLGHNKFVVVSRNGKADSVWTGSANWQPTGLCTQANNGLLVRDAPLADAYLKAWQRLAAAGDSKGGALAAGNLVNPPQVYGLQNGAYAYAQFTSVPRAQPQPLDMAELLDLIAGARQSLLFAMFMPGVDVFDAAVARGSNIFVRGVANTFPRSGSDTAHIDVNLVDNGRKAPSFRLEVVELEGIEHPFATWAGEVTRREFGAIGHAIIHSKILVIDVLGSKPTIVTGSHNFSKTASQSNDENFIVITGNRELAQAYAVNILGLYDHYRWRKYVLDCQQAGRKPWSYLAQDPGWLAKYRASADRKALLDMLGIGDS